MKCSVCKHPQRHQIDCALLAGATLKSLAKPHGLSKSALQRHHVHLKEKINSARQALERSFQQDRLVNYARALDLLQQSAKEAKAGGDVKLSLQLTREANRTNKLMGDTKFHLDDQAVCRGLHSPAFPEQATVIPLDPHIYAHSRRALAQAFADPCPPAPRRPPQRFSPQEVNCHFTLDEILDDLLWEFPPHKPEMRQQYLDFIARLKRLLPGDGEAETRDCQPQPDPVDPENGKGTQECQPSPDPLNPDADLPVLAPVPERRP